MLRTRVCKALVMLNDEQLLSSMARISHTHTHTCVVSSGTPVEHPVIKSEITQISKHGPDRRGGFARSLAQNEKPCVRSAPVGIRS